MLSRLLIWMGSLSEQFIHGYSNPNFNSVHTLKIFFSKDKVTTDPLNFII